MLKINTKVKFPCDKCDYAATTKSNLTKHIEIRHKGVRYPCNLCEYESLSTFNLKRHIENKHFPRNNIDSQ